eukprot:30918-Pelagococcus_subviridis.AAC.5
MTSVASRPERGVARVPVPHAERAAPFRVQPARLVVALRRARPTLLRLERGGRGGRVGFGPAAAAAAAAAARLRGRRREPQRVAPVHEHRRARGRRHPTVDDERRLQRGAVLLARSRRQRRSLRGEPGRTRADSVEPRGV